MSEANIQLAKQGYADFGRGDIPAVLAILDENTEWVIPGDLPDSGTWRGKAAVAKFFQLVGETWDFQAFEPRHYVASDNRVVALGSYTATSRATGKQVSAEWAMVWEFRNGKVARLQEFTDTLALHNAISGRASA